MCWLMYCDFLHTLLLKLFMLQLQLPLSYLKATLLLVQLSQSLIQLKRYLLLLPVSHRRGLMQTQINQVHASLLETEQCLLMGSCHCAGHPAAPHGLVIHLFLKVGEHTFESLRNLCICVTVLTQFLHNV